MTVVIDLSEFTDKQIEDEYAERFGDPDDADIDDFDNLTIREEYEKRFGEADPEPPAFFDEICDLIAEAARTSRHAAKAYSLLRETFDLDTLETRQKHIATRMKDAA